MHSQKLVHGLTAVNTFIAGCLTVKENTISHRLNINAHGHTAHQN